MSDNEYIAKNWEPGDKVFAEDLNRIDHKVEELANKDDPSGAGAFVVNFVEGTIPFTQYAPNFDPGSGDASNIKYFVADKTFEEINNALNESQPVLCKVTIPFPLLSADSQVVLTENIFGTAKLVQDGNTFYQCFIAIDTQVSLGMFAILRSLPTDFFPGFDGGLYNSDFVSSSQMVNELGANPDYMVMFFEPAIST